MKSKLDELKEQVGIPKEQDNLQKLLQAIQLLLFLVIFTVLFLMLCKVFHGFWLRALALVISYVIAAMFLYCVLRPLFQKLGEILRKKH